MTATHSSNTLTGRVTTALLLSLIICGLIGLVIDGMRNLQTFEAFGAAKRYGLPATYALFLIALIMPLKHGYPRASKPLWWSSMCALLFVSTAGALFIPRQDIDLESLAQSCALVGGLLLLSWAGLASPNWTGKSETRIVWIVAVAALVSQIAHVPLGPFVSLAAPACAGLLYASFRLKRFKLAYLSFGLALGLSIFFNIYGQQNVSIALIAQIAASAVLLALAILPVRSRVFMLILTTIVACILFAKSDFLPLMFGKVPAGVEDVTLTHRAYETLTVFELLSSSATSMMLGMGPSGMVDLSSSPDRITLTAAGRNLAYVDDVHFLTSWILLKFGLLGILWLTLIIGIIARVAWRTLNYPKPGVFDIYLLLFLIAGAVSSVPAATNFFANPMGALALGLLIARQTNTRATPRPETQRVKSHSTLIDSAISNHVTEKDARPAKSWGNETMLVGKASNNQSFANRIG